MFKFSQHQFKKHETTWSYSPRNEWLRGELGFLKERDNECRIFPGVFCVLEGTSSLKWLAQLATMARRRCKKPVVSRLRAQATLLTLGLWFFFPAPTYEAVTWVSCRDTRSRILRGKISYLVKIRHGPFNTSETIYITDRIDDKG